MDEGGSGAVILLPQFFRKANETSLIFTSQIIRSGLQSIYLFLTSP